MRRRRAEAPGRHGGATRTGPLRLLAMVAVGGALLSIGACATVRDDAGPRFVTPPLIRYSSVLWPVPLELVGAEPGIRIRITATLSSGRGVWRSGATYTVPASGALDLARARPQLAAFHDPDSAGLFWSLRGPVLDDAELAGQWMHETNPVTLTAADGDRIVAVRTFRLQGLAAAVRSHLVYTRDLARSSLPRQTHEDQPVGRYWETTWTDRPSTPAVLMFDDPSRGASADFVAPLLAQFGASVFVLPATSDDGVRVTSIVDADTIGAVLDWLAQHGTVDRGQVFAYGTGAAEPLALWAAARFPDRLHGLFAGAGSTELLCLPGTSASSVYEDGAGVLCEPRPGRGAPGAVIPVDTIDGPVVLACGEQDGVLPSACSGQRSAAATRDLREGDRMIVGAAAAHAVTVPPGLPIALPGIDEPSGADAQATQEARIAFWNAVGRALLRAALS